jgi:hypothetical protein
MNGRFGFPMKFLIRITCRWQIWTPHEISHKNHLQIVEKNPLFFIPIGKGMGTISHQPVEGTAEQRFSLAFSKVFTSNTYV